VVQTLDYYPYGSQRIATGSSSEQRQFIGEEYDGDTEFSYLNARYYEGSRGQFMSQDPAVVTFDGKDKQLLFDPQQLNSYSYARNNPLILLDAGGEKVYLAASVVVPISPPPGFFDDSYHLYYYVAPDQPYRITENIAPGQGPFTLGAGPQGPFTAGSLLPRLGTADALNNDFKSGLPPGKFVEIVPNGQTEEELIKGLLRGYTSIGQGIDYRALSNQNGRYNGNSNNFAATLAQSAGIQNQFDNFAQNLYAPGSSRGAPTAGSSASYRSASAFGLSGDSRIGLGNIGAFASFISQFIK
jgi:RHS repeat-associated protein